MVERKKLSATWTSSVFFLFLLVIVTAAGGTTVAPKKKSPVINDHRPPCKFPTMYNFGDSNSDTGAISAVFQPIPWPYGQTFFKKPAGRDSDGRNIIDFIAEAVELPYLSAYLNSIGANFSHGANFATGGSTIRRQNETIFEYGISPFSLDVQIWHFDQFKSRTADLYNQVHDPYQKSVLPRPLEFAKALYTFDIGQNDLTVAFRKMSNEQHKVAMPDIISQFSTAIKVWLCFRLLARHCLISSHRMQITCTNFNWRAETDCSIVVMEQHLYEQGGRVFWVHNTGPIGCLPVNTMYLTNPAPGYLDQYGCVKGQNEMAMEFNRQLKAEVVKLRTQLTQAAITYVDLYAAKFGLISSSKSQGFDDPMQICCGYHKKDGNVWCGQKGLTNNGTTVFGQACRHPEASISWDGVHYSEAANHWFANHILDGSLSDPPVPITHACYRN